MFFFQFLLPLVLYAGWTFAYIPAFPTNVTDSIDLDDASHITMKYKPSVWINDVLVLMLFRPGSTGISQGAFVQFSEEKLTSQITTTPWIALVSCDANVTDSSTSVDVFTLARERGATGAVLYSQTSEACELTPPYYDSDQALDIYMPENKAETQKFLMQFDRLPNSSYANYNPVLLNESFMTVQASVSSDNAISSNFMVATLRAPESFFLNDTNGGTDSDPPPSTHSNNPNTGLAMIILYAITGCVSALFIVVILSGAIRAIRHPERYGPRAPGVNGRGLPIGGQTRSGGLGRAILDTFPVVKFNQTPQSESPTPNKDDLEHAPVELSECSPSANHSEDEKTGELDIADAPAVDGEHVTSSSSGSVRQNEHVHVNAKDRAHDDPEPSAMGHETCPICIVDFEEGDNVRVLPCEGKHKFHQACVDPWLLELSSSCPLCREDFHALESMISGGVAQEENNISPAGRSHRFTRYLGFARRRRNMFSRVEQPVAVAEANGENPSS